MPLKPFKLDIVRGIDINVKGYVSDTGCAIRFTFIYRAIGSYTSLIMWVQLRLGNKNEFKITFFDVYGVEHPVENDRDVFEAFKTHGIDPSIIAYHKVIFRISYKDKGFEEQLNEKISLKCIPKPRPPPKTKEEQKVEIAPSMVFKFQDTVHLLPDIRIKFEYDFATDIKANIQELEYLIVNTSSYIRTQRKKLKSQKEVLEEEDEDIRKQLEKLINLQRDLKAHRQTLRFLTSM